MKVIYLLTGNQTEGVVSNLCKPKGQRNTRMNKVILIPQEKVPTKHPLAMPGDK